MEDLIKKFADLIEKYGSDNRLYTFEICADFGFDLEGSTIDCITKEGNTIVFYYNENTGDYDDITAFSREGLEKWLEDLNRECKFYDLENELLDESIDDAEAILEKYGKVRFVDEKIDDGCDEGEDMYVMMRSYDVDNHYVRIYYGDCTRAIGYIDVD